MENAFPFLIIVLIMIMMATVLDAMKVMLFAQVFAKHLILFVNPLILMAHVHLAIPASFSINLLVLL